MLELRVDEETELRKDMESKLNGFESKEMLFSSYMARVSSVL